jgi:hypothetical protein
MTAFAPGNVEIAGMRIAMHRLLNLDRQAVHAASHIGMTDRQPHPNPRGHRDHRDNALTTAAANSGGTVRGIRSWTCPPNAISIAASRSTARSVRFGAAASGGAIKTRGEPVCEAAQFLPPT